jgi:hypothetical protein
MVASAMYYCHPNSRQNPLATHLVDAQNQPIDMGRVMLPPLVESLLQDNPEHAMPNRPRFGNIWQSREHRRDPALLL